MTCGYDGPCERCGGPQGGWLPLPIKYSESLESFAPPSGNTVEFFVGGNHLCRDCQEALFSDIEKLKYLRKCMTRLIKERKANERDR